MIRFVAGVALAVAAIGPRAADAQHEHHDKPAPASGKSSAGAREAERDGKVTSAADQAMAGRMVAGLHVEMTPMRSATRADSQRADSIVRVLRNSIARYKDVRVAERDGYKQFAPNMKGQKVLHYTNNRAAVRAAFGFNAAWPTSLLYKLAENGERELVGAMYTAPKRASADDLDQRVPLSMARWHRHINFCVPPRKEKARWSETQNGQPVFGPLSPIATREECDAVGGKFHPQVFGWMVHANVFAGTDPSVIWEHDHGTAGQHQH